MPECNPQRSHLPLFKHLWNIVDKKFQAKKVLTSEGHAFAQTHAIKGSHGVFPTALNFLALMPSLTNGARAQLFPNAPSPLFCVFLNINYAQVRKSALTAINDAVGQELDAFFPETWRRRAEPMQWADRFETCYQYFRRLLSPRAFTVQR